MTRAVVRALEADMNNSQKTHSREWKVLQKLKMENEDRVSVKINPVCIFLFRDGKVSINGLMSSLTY